MTSARIPVLSAALLLVTCAASADNKPPATERMTSDTRFAVIRSLNAERVYARRPFPMGKKGLTLKASTGQVTPDGPELLGLVTQQGAAARPGDRVQITNVELKGDRILFEINGGPRKKKKWWQHITIQGTGGSAPLDQSGGSPEAHGSIVALVFDGYVPEIPVERVKELLAPVFDFSAHSASQAYLDSLPPRVREAIKKHEALVGMNQEMVRMAKGRPPRKVREREGTQDYEEWIYGTPPEDVEFVRFVGDEVVLVKIMKITGEKIVRTEREVSLEGIVPHRQTATSEEGQQQSPAAPPSLRRPGEADPGSPGVPVSNRPDTRVPGAPDPDPQQAPPTPPQPPPQSWTAGAPAGS